MKPTMFRLCLPKFAYVISSDSFSTKMHQKTVLPHALLDLVYHRLSTSGNARNLEIRSLSRVRRLQQLASQRLPQFAGQDIHVHPSFQVKSVFNYPLPFLLNLRRTITVLLNLMTVYRDWSTPKCRFKPWMTYKQNWRH